LEPLTGTLGLILLALAIAALAATGALGAACLGARNAVELLLSAYAIAWTQVVAVALLLSPLDLVTREGLLAGLASTSAAVALVWHLRGRPRPPSLRPALWIVRGELRSPLVATLAIVVGICSVYILALAFLTPALEWDPLAYHLPRAALWAQQQSVAYVPNASDLRLDGNPPGAEIGILAGMLLTGDDRFAALPQVFALGALVVGIAGIARRLGSTHGQAMMAALVFAGLPLVALQAPTSYNDLVVASFVVAAGFAILGRTRLDLVLLALSVGMALTTKLTALIAFPLLVLLALVGAAPRRWPWLAGAGIAGILLGAPWYVLNLAETGDADGGLAEHTEQRQTLSLLAVMPTIRRYVFSFVDFSGSRGIGVFTLYGGVAAAVLVTGLIVGLVRGRLRDSMLVALGAAAVVTLPLALVELGRGALRGWFKFWLVVGREDISHADASWQLQVGSDAALSWYGPVAAALLVVGTPFALCDVVRRRRPPAVAVLACAPFVFIVIFSLLVPWDPWRGRFMVAAVAFAVAAWAPLLERRSVGWGVVAMTAVALPLSLLAMYTKPSSLPFIHGHEGPSIWTDPWEVVFARLAEVDGVVRTSATIDRGIRGPVVVASREDDFLYLYLRHGNGNDVALVPVDGGRVPDEATWLVMPPGTSVVRCGRWRLAVSEGGWRAWRRTGAGPCTTVSVPRRPSSPVRLTRVQGARDGVETVGASAAPLSNAGLPSCLSCQLPIAVRCRGCLRASPSSCRCSTSSRPSRRRSTTPSPRSFPSTRASS
jgi:hypothetical protein